MVTVGQTGHTEIVFASSLSAGDGVSTDHLQLFENFEQLLLMIGGGAASLGLSEFPCVRLIEPSPIS